MIDWDIIAKLEFEWDEDKSRKVKLERGRSLEEIIEYIKSGRVISVMKHYNLDRYPNQLLIVVEIEGYPWVVPCEIRGSELRIITAYPSRKFKKLIDEGKYGK